MTDTSFDSPALLMRRLEEIERDLAERQNDYEAAARRWFLAKREKERARAISFIEATGTVAERNAIADRDTSMCGSDEEADFEGFKVVTRVLETRASINQSVLRAQSRTVP